MITAAEVLRISKAVARRYAARCWWADVDDLTSEATVAVLEARRTWDPQVGVPFDGYAARAAALKLRTALWRMSSPVSGGLDDPHANLAGLHHAELPTDGVLQEEPSAFDVIEHQQWRQQVRARFAAIAAATKDGHLATRVLVDGQSSGEVIAETGGRVYQAVHLVRRKARVDSELYALWEESP